VLRGLATPALVVKGSCDYLPWSVATDYRDTLPAARMVYCPVLGTTPSPSALTRSSPP